MTRKKQLGQIMTPAPIVKMVLDAAGYSGPRILEKKIIEPSFGDGAFISEIASRLIDECEKTGKTGEEIRNIIENNVYGFEIDPALYEKAVENLKALAKKRGVSDIEPKNLILGDAALEYEKWAGQMDFCAGNPPYVRIHNLSDRHLALRKKFPFCEGMTDLYIMFYALGLELLNETGRLCFISANSFMKNASQKKFRDHLIESGAIAGITNFRSSRVFEDALTYPCICLLDKSGKTAEISCREYGFDGDVSKTALSRDDFRKRFLGQAWILASGEESDFMDEIRQRPVKLKDIAIIQNGVATNMDSIYVGQAAEVDGAVYFTNESGTRAIEGEILRRCVKASAFDGEIGDLRIIFPYKKAAGQNRISYDEAELAAMYPLAYAYLSSQKDRLEKRDMEKGRAWFSYARNQGLFQAGRRKLVFKHIIKGENPEIVPYLLDEDVIVYSGIYTIMRKGHENRLADIMAVYASRDFARYCALSGSDKAGGYVALKSSIIGDYGII